MSDFIKSDAYTPMGDPDKAAKAMIALVEHPEPPVHLILGSEGVDIVKRATITRQAELEKWISVSRSTDHDDAVNFLDTEAGQILTHLKSN